MILGFGGDLRRIGAVRTDVPDELWLCVFAKKLTGVDRLEWLDPNQASKTIEALKNWLKREQEKINSAPACSRAKAAAFTAAQLIAEAPKPTEYIRRFLLSLTAHGFATPEIDAEIGNLVDEFARRVSRR